MTYLVIGSGAENSDDQLGMAVVNLATSGRDVQGLDLGAAEASCLKGSPAELVEWWMAEIRPSLVLLVDVHESLGMVEIDGASLSLVIHAERSTALAALELWSRGEPSAEALTSEAASLLELLQANGLDGPQIEAIRTASPRVSLIIAIHNHEAFLHATMKAALSQTFDDYDVVVLDDGSTDASARMLEQYESNPRVSLISQSNLGHTARMDLVWNRLVRESRGDLIALLGGDDVILPHRLSAQVAAFDEDPELDICHSAMWTIDPEGKKFDFSLSLPVAYDELSIARMMLVDNIVFHPTVMISRRAHEKWGLYEEGLASDYHFWMKSAGRAKYRYLPQRLIEYRMHANGLSTSPEGSARCAAEARRLRSLIFSRRGLRDFFPELGESRDPQTWYEAALSLGNQLMGVDPRLALQVYDSATEHHRGPELHHNRAIAHLLAGDRDAAVRHAERGAVDFDDRWLLESLLSGAQFQASLRSPDDKLSSALADGRRAMSRATRWDGSPLSVNSAYVGFEAGSLRLGVQAMREWASVTRGDMPLRWVFPDLGAGAAAALELLAHAASDVDLANCAGLSIEALDDFGLLPPDASRTTGMLTEAGYLAAFGEWVRREAARATVAAAS